MKLMKIIGWIILIPFILWALFALAKFLFCGPDREVVKIASPVAKIIADEIMKNGIPESLKNIEGLPYSLEECEKKKVYKKQDIPTRIVQNKAEADFVIIEEKCNFKNRDNIYLVNIFFTDRMQSKLNIIGDVEIISSNTRIGYRLNYDENSKTLSSEGVHVLGINHSDFCNFGRQ